MRHAAFHSMVLDRLRAARLSRARASPSLVSRPAGPLCHRIPAGRRHRHVLPADLARPRHRARRLDRDREQGRRRRLHRLADGRALASRRLHGAGGGKCARHQPGAVQEASVRLQPARDYDAVGAMASTPLVWTVANNVPANTFKEFVAWSKTAKDKFTYGHAGPGSVSHLVPEVILDGTGMQALPVPFKGGGPAAQAVAGGHVSVVASSLAGRQDAGRRQARQEHVRDQHEALAGAAGRAVAARNSATSSPTWTLSSGGACLSRRACRSRSAPGLKKPCKPPWRTRRCASGSLKVDTDPSFAPGQRCGSSSRTRSTTGRSSSTPRASRSSSRCSARSGIPALAGA